MNKFLIIFTIIMGFTSCEEETEVHFEEPMGKKELTSFDNDLIGSYIGELDSSVIEVGNTWIIHSGTTYFKYSKTLIDSASHLIFEGNLIIDTVENVSYDYLTDGDSIVFGENWIDTIFNISYNQLLMKDNKRYYLNYNEGADWIVRTLDVDKAILKIGRLKIDSLKLVHQYTEVSRDTLDNGEIDHHIISPTKKEFKKIMKSDVFEYDQEYLKNK